VQVNVVALADQRATKSKGVTLIASECWDHHTSHDMAWLYVYRETTRRRLKPLWCGELTRPEIGEIKSLLRRTNKTWHGSVDTYAWPGDPRFRMLWTLAPAPCRVYCRWGPTCEVDPAGVTRYGLWRTQRISAAGVERVEGWFTWTGSGIKLKRRIGGNSGVIRLRHPGEWLGYYDGIDLMIDTDWLQVVTPRVAEVLGVDWSIVDYTETPPAVTKSGPTAGSEDGESDR